MIPGAGPWAHRPLVLSSGDLTGLGHLSLHYMDEHHGEATKTSVLWKKSNSIHPGYLASIQRVPWKYLNELAAGLGSMRTLCFRAGMVQGR